jgi:hypothetical protein
MKYQEGSFYWYKFEAGHFMAALCEAFMKADLSNCRKLALGFPEVYKAHNMPSWDIAPEKEEKKEPQKLPKSFDFFTNGTRSYAEGE